MNDTTFDLTQDGEYIAISGQDLTSIMFELEKFSKRDYQVVSSHYAGTNVFLMRQMKVGASKYDISYAKALLRQGLIIVKHTIDLNEKPSEKTVEWMKEVELYLNAK